MKTYEGTVKDEKNDTEYALGTEEYMQTQLPKKMMFHTRVNKWLWGIHNPLSDDLLRNSVYKKNTAYHWFSHTPLGHKSIIKFISFFFDKSHKENAFTETVNVHENAVWLYRSPQAHGYLWHRWCDYAWFIWMPTLLISIGNPFFLCASIGYIWNFNAQMTRKKFFTHRADLLPHTEQVVFEKAGFFGKKHSIVVDIKNL